MIFAWSAAVARHRKVVLLVTAGVVGAVLVARLSGVAADDLAPRLGYPAFVILLFSLVLVFGTRGLPRVLDVDEAARAFRTPLIGVPHTAGAAHLLGIGVLLLYPGQHIGETVLAVVVYAGYLRAQWVGVSVILTADGVRAEKFAGAMTVPWSAFAVDLSIRPEKVQVSGIVFRKSLPVETIGTDSAFLTAAIRHFVERPEERAMIGTAAGLAAIRE